MTPQAIAGLAAAALVAAAAGRAAEYRDGTFFGMARDQSSKTSIKLEVTVRQGRIRDIVFLQTPSYRKNQAEAELMRQRILASQETGVLATAMTTAPSRLVREAVADALSRADPAPEAWSGPAETGPRIEIDTTLGTMEAVLYPALAPLTSEKFLALVREGYYDKWIVRKTIARTLLQVAPGTGSRVEGGVQALEPPAAGAGFDRVGMIGISRDEVPGFVVNAARAPWLDGQYVIVGRITRGFKIIAEIALNGGTLGENTEITSIRPAGAARD
ncbi:MAG TPA: peptidylprolyl isomerase [bacterium]|nr:peptidylprolyl isomerase [bacterium]HPJ71734.1 peptidylprolyl isomerase [bacterium]HPQ66763.1 peptidylprolyl isomerase [bacterium]